MSIKFILKHGWHFYVEKYRTLKFEMQRQRNHDVSECSFQAVKEERKDKDSLKSVLIYYRFFVSFQFLEMLFDLDGANICRHLQKIEPILASAIKINKNGMLTQSE